MIYNINADGLKWATIEQANIAMHAPRFRVMFIFNVGEMMAQAANEAYVSGTSQKDSTPDSEQALRQYFDINEEGNAPILMRELKLAVSKVESSMAGISAGRLDGNRSYDIHTSPTKEVIIEVYVSSQTSDATISSLGQHIEEYLIDSLLLKWSALTNPTMVEFWGSSASAAMEQLESNARQCQGKHFRIPKFPAW